MSIDCDREVRSKYFIGKTAMDESLSDFQEAKKSCKGPKPVQKPKPKIRKVTKHIKGQKDIRTAIKGKKNELLTYSKDFDTVCKKSGLDVDPEQLQLAIALSKSLHTEPSNTPECSQTLSSQERVSKIRRTLQEYGFKVPDAKITNKKSKKTRNQYKLLTISEEEKHQIVSKKYSQILFSNLDTTLGLNSNYQDYNSNLFNLTTNISYEYIKDGSLFYVENLIEKSTTSGSLLRDWSEIPGRPVSPKLLDTDIMDVKEIDCSQDDLDVILSGPIKLVKDIIATTQIGAKRKYNKSGVPKVIIDHDEQNVDTVSDLTNSDKKNEEVHVRSPDKEVVIIDMLGGDNQKSTQQYRSCSPDIFDDELSSIMETTKPIIVLSQEHKTEIFTDNVMDLTQCAALSQNIPLPQNMTKRKSNDFMEITECIVGSSQAIREEIKEIDLTQNPENKEELIEEHHNKHNTKNSSIIILNDIDHTSNESLIENNSNLQNETVVPHNFENNDSHLNSKEDIDLTQSSNEDENIVTDAEETPKIPDKEKSETMDLTQSSNSNDIDNLPFVDIGNTQSEKSLDNTIIVNAEEYIAAISKVKTRVIASLSPVFDLTQEAGNMSIESNANSIGNRNAESFNNSHCNSFFDEFLHDHSENSEVTDDVNPSDDANTSHNRSRESNDIDLTQSSDKSEENLRIIPNNSSLGKRGDVSIDYDEIVYNTSAKDSIREIENNNSQQIKFLTSQSAICKDLEFVEENNDFDINSSQNSEVFHISDKELDYSLHKSRYDERRNNFDVGGISILDNITSLGSIRKSLEQKRISNVNKNYTMGDSFLPEVNVKKNDKPMKIEESNKETLVLSSHVVKDIFKNDSGEMTIRTPNKTKYIIKTNNVTPMADYAAMDTPQRNRELDKYGLKPLKRKRAIQILTHIYNQTHPTIQQLDEEQPSPKKRRQDTKTRLSPRRLIKSPQSSPSKIKTDSNSKVSSLNVLLKSPNQSPVKKSKHKAINMQKSPKKLDVVSDNAVFGETEVRGVADVCAYEVTSEAAVIRSVDCSPDDWVFQKREKAKVHSCRVPLHIAFHNYMSSRRGLREAILKYEPVNIDVIHKDLVGYGHRYDPKDLLKFLDKKCITVKTTDNNSRNNKR